MRHNLKSLIGFQIGATDGDIGKVEDFYFDDQTWTVRYLVVKTGGWLSGREVLISPIAVQQPNWNEKIFPANLTKEQVKHSPDIDTEKPVNRQQETELYNHYSWPYEVDGGAGFYGSGMGMMGMTSPAIPFEEGVAANEDHSESGNPHLRSLDELKGYTLHALDGKIGELEDIIVDGESWQIKYLVVDTGNWFPGKKVIISPQQIKNIDWAESEVVVNLTEEAVKESPEYDPEVPVHEIYETSLNNHYGRFIK